MCLRQTVRAEEGIHFWLSARSRHGCIPTNGAASLHTPAGEGASSSFYHRPSSPTETPTLVFSLTSPPPSHISHLGPPHHPHLLIWTLSHQNHAHPALAHSRFLRQKWTSWDRVGFRTRDQALCMQTLQGAALAHQSSHPLGKVVAVNDLADHRWDTVQQHLN